MPFPTRSSRTPTTCPRWLSAWVPHLDRIAYDAPIATVADLEATPLEAGTFNIKPSRVGRLETLFELYAACQERGLGMYGGGMGELGVARGQIQLLASLFSPNGPNDIAPSGFNALDPTHSTQRWTSRRARCRRGPRRRGSAAPSRAAQAPGAPSTKIGGLRQKSEPPSESALLGGCAAGERHPPDPPGSRSYLAPAAALSR